MVDLTFHKSRYQASMERQVAVLRGRLVGMDLQTWAALTGGRYERGGLQLMVFGEPMVVESPGFDVFDGRTGEPAPINTQALLLYHLCTTDGAPLTGRWISFRELPDGGFYHQAFQGYTGNRIATTMGNDVKKLRLAAERLGGEEEEHGDASWRFAALPRVPLLLVYWQGDEEFRPTARILFDASAGHHLPADACALLGSTLTQRLVAAATPTD